MANSQEVYVGDSNNDRQSEMAAETGNTYISETMKGTVKIPTTNLGYRWKRVLASEVKQRPTTGIIDVAHETGNNYISGTLTDSVEILTPDF